MAAFGLVCGLVAGQYGSGRTVRAELYSLKRDVAQLRQACDALTAAGERSGEVASLLSNLREQRVAVDDAAKAWRAADAALAARLRERADAVPAPQIAAGPAETAK